MSRPCRETTVNLSVSTFVVSDSTTQASVVIFSRPFRTLYFGFFPRNDDPESVVFLLQTGPWGTLQDPGVHDNPSPSLKDFSRNTNVEEETPGGPLTRRKNLSKF